MNSLQDRLLLALQRSVGLLDESHAALRTETIEYCDRLQNPTYRIAVFGPFNYGKSTLLNALLGEKTLPMDLVPTTGAAITVKYGAEHRTCVTYVDGSVQQEDGVEALQQFAVLDEQRQMRADVTEVVVHCPHPLLKMGLELVDLPGTDDQQAQNDLVQAQLLSTDLVIQVLDGRKLMTLAERENLRDWLLDRGINTVIFVVNFLNLMEAGDRQQVSSRLRFLSESFRASLPSGVSNLYQVDALPALRARLKGDMAAATQTGLPALESALQTIGRQVDKGRPPEQTLPRMKALAVRLRPALQQQIEKLSVVEADSADVQRIAIKEKARSLIQQGFDRDVAKLQSWLAPKNLQAHYRLDLAQALKTKTTQDWLVQTLKPAWYERQRPIVNWVHQACDFFERDHPPELWMAFSAGPEVAEPVAAEVVENRRDPDMAPVAIATGLGWVLGGPLGAAVFGSTSHLINKGGRKKQTVLTPEPIDFQAQADVYLDRFSVEALEAIATYKQTAQPTIQTKLSPPITTPSPAKIAQINLLKTTAEELSQLIEESPSFD